MATYSMICASGDYMAGVIYSHTQRGLLPGRDYIYQFLARDSQSNDATPAAERDAPGVGMPLRKLHVPLILRR